MQIAKRHLVEHYANPNFYRNKALAKVSVIGITAAGRINMGKL